MYFLPTLFFNVFNWSEGFGDLDVIAPCMSFKRYSSFAITERVIHFMLLKKRSFASFNVKSCLKIL